MRRVIERISEYADGERHQWLRKRSDKRKDGREWPREKHGGYESKIGEYCAYHILHLVARLVRSACIAHNDPCNRKQVECRHDTQCNLGR